jgi:hypothetical protein
MIFEYAVPRGAGVLGAVERKRTAERERGVFIRESIVAVEVFEATRHTDVCFCIFQNDQAF